MSQLVLLSLTVFLAASVSFAHIEPGVYKGATDKNEVCEMTVIRQYFENNKPHPLNERIELQIAGETFKVGHPPVIDAKNSVVFFNHDMFQGLVPTDTGAKAVEITMVHSEEFEGPSDFTVIENKWRSGEKSRLKCLEIKLIK